MHWKKHLQRVRRPVRAPSPRRWRFPASYAHALLQRVRVVFYRLALTQQQGQIAAIEFSFEEREWDPLSFQRTLDFLLDTVDNKLAIRDPAVLSLNELYGWMKGSCTIAL